MEAASELPSVLDMEYTFHATQNNGRITKQKNWTSGEEVNYTYDSLNRLLTAATTSTAWGLSFGYDGFGNKLSQTVTKGSGPTMNVTVDAATNRLVGSTYDANGNLTVGSGLNLTYDISNRIATAAGPSNESYAYAPGNKRVWKKRQTGGSTYEENVYFHAASGQRLGAYTLTDASGTLALTVKSMNVYFGGKLIKEGTSWVALDRLGSVRARLGDGLTTFDHFPYGEEKPSTTAQDRDKFATYFRDHTNLDYADNRYYTSGMGRFVTPDPYQASGGSGEPTAWNRYAYVESDPINKHDPRGLFSEMPHLECFVDAWGLCGWQPFPVAPLPMPAPTSPGFAPMSQEKIKQHVDKVKGSLAEVAAVLAAAYENDQKEEADAFPRYLSVKNDYFECWGNQAERNIDYQLHDNVGKPMHSGMVVEHLFPTDFDAQVVGPRAGFPANQSGNLLADGTFHDEIRIEYGPERSYYQSFTVRGLPMLNGKFSYEIPVFVRGFGGDYGILSVHKTYDSIVINGNAGSPKKCR